MEVMGPVLHTMVAAVEVRAKKASPGARCRLAMVATATSRTWIGSLTVVAEAAGRTTHVKVLLKVAVGVAVTPAIAVRRRQEAMADPTLVVAAVVVLLTV